MEFMLDTANLEEIEMYVDLLPIGGVTTNPSIIKKEGTIDFFEHMNKIRTLIGFERSLHIQVVDQDYESMLKDALSILEHIDDQVYIKVPVTLEGVKLIKELKRRNIKVTATAIYSTFQAYLAISAKADYLAPYYNRMENLTIDASQTISDIYKRIEISESTTKILAASFKNVSQVTDSFKCGSHSATMSVDIISTAFSMPSIQQAVDDFQNDFEDKFSFKNIHELL